MTRRRLLLFAAATCLLLAGPFVWQWATTPPPGVTLENFQRLHPRMTLRDAQDILGRPDEIAADFGYWTGTDGDVRIIQGGTKIYGEFLSSDRKTLHQIPRSGSLVETLRRWFGL